MEPLGLILEHVIAHTALDGVTHQTGALDDLMDELVSLVIDVHLGVNTYDQNGDGTHRANQLEAESSVPHFKTSR